MRVRVDEWNEAGPVLMISWPRAKQANGLVDTQVAFWEGSSIRHPYLTECTIQDNEVGNFVMLPSEFDHGRSYCLMWKPLADSGLWNDACEHDAVAIKKLALLLANEGIIGS